MRAKGGKRIALPLDRDRRTIQSMEAAARLTSKGQITIPAEVRRVLQLRKGDQLLFEIESSEGGPGFQVKVSKVPDFFALAGSVPTPPEAADKSYEEIRETAWAEAAAGRYGEEGHDEASP